MLIYKGEHFTHLSASRDSYYTECSKAKAAHTEMAKTVGVAGKEW